MALAGELGGSMVVGTFDPHPSRVLRPDAPSRLLTSLPHKRRLLERMGVEHLLVIPFTDQFASQEPEAFVLAMVDAARPLGGIVTGEDFCFGNGRRGNIRMLAEIGREHGFKAIAVPPVAVDGSRVSSTALRRAVELGDFEACQRLLGRRHTVLGVVIRGRELGRTLGFPTANLAVASEQLPPHGVYAMRAWLDGREFAGVANLGVRPTVDEEPLPKLEVHLFGLREDIYGRELELEFVRFLRPEKRFDGLEDLKAQIALDAEEARGVMRDPGADAGKKSVNWL